MAQTIKRGILQSFNPANYTASVLLLEATSTFLEGVPCSLTIDGTSAQPGAFCAVLFFDEHNLQDAVMMAVYPNGAQGVPTPLPGRVTFVAGYQQFSSVTINAGVTQTFSLSGGGSGIAAGALGVLFKAYFTSATVGSFINLAPHSATPANYITIGNLAIASGYVNGGGMLAVDSSGKIDIQAGAGNCTVTLYTYGYII